ncbi:LysR substrate-binding domain-containing protein [Shouchella hunanensis]|uniref:LysR substrate-binding domain-containing protein n=1 Tax=Shouchella hunanensis TaxID=766894 RepID=A0ABY7W0A6_9BACI|nr:LysR substrate-binding domain-containing protein [Shouchella hunanensis]WDF02392.1 LysR substrate-binding domain-containing protein [Shouchella hunanensis]
MNIDEIETFITLVQEKNFTKTAEKRSLSQPTVSVQIKNLENQFQTQFIRRTTRQIYLTEDGHFFYKEALKIQHIYRNIQESLYARHHEASGLLKIGASFTIGEYLLPQMIASLKGLYPNLTFAITIANTDTIMQKVQHFDVDFGLVEGTIKAKNIEQTPFKHDQLVIICSTRDVEHYQTINDLQNQSWVIREEGSGTRESFETLIETFQLTIHSSITISSTQGIKEGVKNGLGLAFISESAIQEELRNGSLQVLNHLNLQTERQFSFIHRQGVPVTKNTKRFIKHALSLD